MGDYLLRCPERARDQTMSGRVGHRKRLICINAGNLRANHLYLTGHADFFPADCYGAPSSKGTPGKPLRLDVDGIAEPVLTDIPTEAKSGKPRRFFRKRAWVREFFKKTGAIGGKSTAAKYTSEQRSAWGKSGGRPRKDKKGDQ